MSLLIRGASQVATPIGNTARRGAEFGRVSTIENAVVRCEGPELIFVGAAAEHDLRFSEPDRVLDATGCCVIPGFVDPHTHPVWAGSREEEFNRRLVGESYMDIARSGGGINATVRATRAATFDELLQGAMTRLDTFMEYGTTTIEAKSGYGLDLATEVRMLEVIGAADRNHPVDLHPTCLAAHEVPLEHRHEPDRWVTELVEEIHPSIVRRGLAGAVDVFCEDGVFSVDQTRRILADADALGWRIHLHADELTPLGGAELAVEFNALSADHFMCITDGGIAALAASETIGVLLPGTSFFLRSGYAPARRMVEAGCAVALATDCNPGSSPTESMPMILALATLQMGLTIEEALTGATLNAAAALDRAAEIGSLEAGKRADIAVLNGPSYHHLVYHYGVNPIRHVVKNGEIVIRDGHRVDSKSVTRL